MTQQTTTTTAEKTPATVIDMGSSLLPEPKFPPKPTTDGRTSTLHSLTTLRGVGVKLGGTAGSFTYRSATGETPALMHCFVQGMMNVHVYDLVNPESLRDGKVPVDVEICANIVRNAEGRIVDRHAYFNVRPAAQTNGGEPERVVTVHHVNNLPLFNAEIYRGRKSAVVIRAATELNKPRS